MHNACCALLTQSPCTENDYHHTARQPSWTWISDMHEGRALALSSLPEAPFHQPHSGRVLSSSRGSVSGPGSVRSAVGLARLRGGAANAGSCAFAYGNPELLLLMSSGHRLSAGGHSPGPTRWDNPWPHSRVAWNSGWEDPWTAQRRVVTECTCPCHHYTWECQFICWHRLNPKLHHLHSLIFSLVFPLAPAIPIVLLKVTDKPNSRPFSQSLALWLPGAAKTILCFFLQEASLS